MKKIIKKISVLILILALLGCEGLLSFAADSSDQQITGKTVIGESDNIVLSVDEFGHFEALNKSSGYTWNSYPVGIENDTKTVGISRRHFQSELVVNYVYRDEFGKTSSYEENSVAGIEAVEGGAVSVYKTENGAKVVYDFYSICASVALHYSLNEGHLSVEIKGEDILEGDAFKKKVKDYATTEQLEVIQPSYITSIRVLPAFGAGTENENGYVFVPDGSGAYMDFKPTTHVAQNVTVPFYGPEYAIDEYGVVSEEFASVTRPLKAYFPMYAIVKDNDSIMGVIKTGEERSALNAFKAGISNAYTVASPSMIYREISHNVIGGRKVQGVSLTDSSFADFKIDYYFLNDSVDFAGLAKQYRALLEADERIAKSEAEYGLALNVIGAIDVDSHFLGIPCRRIKALTTYEQLGNIITELSENGIEDISVNYIGWNNNGIQNKKINNSFKALGKLGGKSDLNKLISLSKEKDTKIYFDADLQSFKKSGNGVSKLKNAVKTMFDKQALQRKLSYATFSYESSGYVLADAASFSKSFKNYIKTADKYDDIALSFNSIASRLYSNFDNRNPDTRTEMLDAYEKSLSTVKTQLSAADAYSYMWKYADKIFEAPASSSRQRIYDGEIPMYQMILHGYIPYTVPSINSNANRKELLLRAVETGSELLFTVMYENAEMVNGTDFDYLYSTTYKEVKAEALEMYDRYIEVTKRVCDATVESYKQLQYGVSETVYSNGVSVIVNYTDTEYITADGLTVPALDFKNRG